MAEMRPVYCQRCGRRLGSDVVHAYVQDKHKVVHSGCATPSEIEEQNRRFLKLKELQAARERAFRTPEQPPVTITDYAQAELRLAALGIHASGRQIPTALLMASAILAPDVLESILSPREGEPPLPTLNCLR